MRHQREVREVGGPDPEFDLAARQAQVVGEPPRIEPLPQEELGPEEIAIIRALGASVGVAPLAEQPEYFRTMVKHPALFECQLRTGTALFLGTIPARERELAVLRVAWRCRAPYAWGEHVALGRKYGLTGEEIERVTQGSAAAGWSAHDAAILRGVEELLDDCAIDDATWATLALSWDQKQLIEFPAIVGAYVTTAFQQNGLRMRLGEGNPGLTAR